MGKTDAYYFSHDSNALTDQKILSMRCDYGLEGYGLYWAIIEMLRNEETYKLPLNKNTYRAIKMQTGTTLNVEKYISDCIKEYIGTSENGLFNTDGECFWSESLLKRMGKVDEVRKKRKEAGKKGLEKRWNKKEDNDSKKIKIKTFTRKNSKSIANAINYNSKCNSKSIANAIKNFSKSIAKNSKGKEMKRNEMKIKSIYPSNHVHKENKTLDEMMDKTDKIEFENIISNSELQLLDPNLSVEIKEILKELYTNIKTKEKIKTINSKKLLYALKQFAIANTKKQIQIPKQYFKKCILSALEQTELSTQYDTDTIYQMIE